MNRLDEDSYIPSLNYGTLDSGKTCLYNTIIVTIMWIYAICGTTFLTVLQQLRTILHGNTGNTRESTAE